MMDNPRHLSWKSLGSGMLGFSLQSAPPVPGSLEFAGFCTEDEPGSKDESMHGAEDEIFFDGCHALLRFERPGSTLAQAQGFHDVWSFKRCGVWQPWISIRRVGKDRDLGVFRLVSGQPGNGRWMAALTFRQGTSCQVAGIEEGILRLSSCVDESEVLVEIRTTGLPMAGAGLLVARSLGNSDTFLFAAFLWYLLVLSAMEKRSGPFLASLGLGGFEAQAQEAVAGCS